MGPLQHSTYISKLDRVQEFAGKVVNRRWSATGSDLVVVCVGGTIIRV